MLQKFTGSLPQVTINGKHIEDVNSHKCLGITIDKKLSWDKHTPNICKSFAAKIKKLDNMRSMSKMALKTRYLVISYLWYWHMGQLKPTFRRK